MDKRQSKKSSRKQDVGKDTQTNPPGRLSPLPANYSDVLSDLKMRIHTTQLKAATSVNRELLILYQYIGSKLSEQNEQAGWGDKVVGRLAEDLKKSFPEMKGFSRSNLFYMKQFYLAYKDSAELVQQAVGLIPWGHNLLILSKIKDPVEREWYIQKSLENNWSRNTLGLQIKSGLYQRQGKAITNFSITLPAHQSDLAREVLKDPYVFDFLTTGEEAHERALQKELLKHITRFLLELGAGFAFVGEQYHLEVSENDFFIDLLFYHTKLHCFVAIELKTGVFKPEYAGKINFYLSALDDLVKSQEDNPSLGIVLCAAKDKVLAEYALRDMSKPIGVSEYSLTKAIPENLKPSLPTVEELEAELIEKG